MICEGLKEHFDKLGAEHKQEVGVCVSIGRISKLLLYHTDKKEEIMNFLEACQELGIAYLKYNISSYATTARHAVYARWDVDCSLAPPGEGGRMLASRQRIGLTKVRGDCVWGQERDIATDYIVRSYERNRKVVIRFGDPFEFTGVVCWYEGYRGLVKTAIVRTTNGAYVVLPCTYPEFEIRFA